MPAPPSARPALGDPVPGPRHQAVEGRDRIGQIGLQHDPCLEARQGRLLEQRREDRDRQVEIAVLLHVEVDELGAAGCRGLLVQRRQPLHDARHGLVEAPHRQLTDNRRDLDRHVVDVIPGQQLLRAAQSAARLAVSEHRLAEQVDIEPDAAGAQSLQGLPQRLRVGIDDEVRDHAAEHPPRDRDDRPRQDPGEAASHRDRRAQVPGQEPRDAVRELFEVPTGHPQVFGADHLVDEAERELEPARVFEHTGQSLGARVGLDVGAGGEPVAHQGDGLFGRRQLGGRAWARGSRVGGHRISLAEHAALRRQMQGSCRIRASATAVTAVLRRFRTNRRLESRRPEDRGRRDCPSPLSIKKLY